jgi:hypothetical protein
VQSVDGCLGTCGEEVELASAVAFIAKLSIDAAKDVRTATKHGREPLRKAVLANRLSSMPRESAHEIGRHASALGLPLCVDQGYEPYFSPRGSEYTLADDTYRFGFRTMALGGMAERPRAIHRIEVDRIPFGTDLSVYRMTKKGPGSGVVLYAKPRVARRGYALAMAPLHEFHQQHPGQEIHLSGDPHIRPQFPAHVHGTVSPRALAELYKRSIAGLSISFTNISLVPYELLACGAIPVIKGDPFACAELSNRARRWTMAAPSAIADRLSHAVSCADTADAPKRAATEMEGRDWQKAKQEFVKIVEDETFRKKTNAQSQRMANRARNSDL